LIHLDAKDAVPLWRQIELGMQRLVASGALGPGATVPSVRELAQELGVNPMTVSKAYQKLSEAGVLEVRRGEGTFVPQNPPLLARAERARAVREHAARLASAALTLGVSERETVDELKDTFARLRKDGGGTR
jgi:GntR family transcriptional regulator